MFTIHAIVVRLDQKINKKSMGEVNSSVREDRIITLVSKGHCVYFRPAYQYCCYRVLGLDSEWPKLFVVLVAPARASVACLSSRVHDHEYNFQSSMYYH